MQLLPKTRVSVDRSRVGVLRSYIPDVAHHISSSVADKSGNLFLFDY